MSGVDFRVGLSITFQTDMWSVADVFLHGQFVLSRSSVRYEGESPGGGVVKCHTDTPQIHAHAIGFLMRLAQYGTFIHVWMLHTQGKKYICHLAPPRTCLRTGYSWPLTPTFKTTDKLNPTWRPFFYYLTHAIPNLSTRGIRRLEHESCSSGLRPALFLNGHDINTSSWHFVFTMPAHTFHNKIHCLHNHKICDTKH